MDATFKISSITPSSLTIQPQLSTQEDGSTATTTNGEIGNGSNHAPPLQVRKYEVNTLTNMKN